MNRETGSASYKPLEGSQSLTLGHPTQRKQVPGHPSCFSNQWGKSQTYFSSNYSWLNRQMKATSAKQEEESTYSQGKRLEESCSGETLSPVLFVLTNSDQCSLSFTLGTGQSQPRGIFTGIVRRPGSTVESKLLKPINPTSICPYSDPKNLLQKVLPGQGLGCSLVGALQWQDALKIRSREGRACKARAAQKQPPSFQYSPSEATAGLSEDTHPIVPPLPSGQGHKSKV